MLLILIIDIMVVVFIITSFFAIKISVWLLFIICAELKIEILNKAFFIYLWNLSLLKDNLYLKLD